ncbi:MAG: DUF1579 domain-containing protein [Planctomycetota bacterium]|nr:DUF1579 domain-containing protein [Planctomycetota bacterium]MDA1178597.1 DUF1579 domain-containing protein [Planctomycetota bacterium]
MTRPRMFRRLFVSICLSTAPVGMAQGPTQPGPEHAILRELEGTWDAVVKMEGHESKATATYKMDLGGLWLISNFQGNFGGAPYQGHGIDGYDQARKKYVSYWFDSMTSAAMAFDGDYDASTKTLTMSGEGPGPDGKPAKFKTITRNVDKNHHTFEMLTVGKDGKDTSMMKIEYSRRL